MTELRAIRVMPHRAFEQGVIGVQMTWSGPDFDDVSGLSALVIACGCGAEENSDPIRVQ